MRVRAVFLFSFLIPAACWGQISMPAHWRFMPPEPSLLAGLDWRQASQSSFSKVAAGNVNLDFADELGSILMAAEPGAAKGRFLAVATGRFNLSKLRRMASAEGARALRYRGLEIFDSGGVQVTLAGGGVFLAGDAASLRAGIERGSNVTPREGAIWRRAADLGSRYPLWAVSTEPPPAGSPLLAGVRAFAGGVALQNGLELAFDLETESEAAAQTLAAALQLAPAVSGLAIQANGSEVAMKASWNPERPEVWLKEISNWLAASPARPPPPSPPQRKTILIVGLDEGTREIPVTSLQR